MSYRVDTEKKTQLKTILSSLARTAKIARKSHSILFEADGGIAEAKTKIKENRMRVSFDFYLFYGLHMVPYKLRLLQYIVSHTYKTPNPCSILAMY